ncbi:ABC transporter substrate-binding protein [Sphingomonas sp. EC-HK361]|uniref:ABC transporter substrate-binding protein n=1 Tax=Sphingomonas sp. EC-HK361 TaxID=2038397 RepID=UPI0012568E3F|nr:ABC transporter substrate-binding protein [Sphingomonas sp. EC-HK361]VVT02339.1 ABC transporter substrate-binding protein [Sphingomonas sp. EC-HK361]
MTRRAILPLLLLAGCAPAHPAVRGGGIVSTNPCADAILLRFAAPDRIAAISRYSQDPAATSIDLETARKFRGVAGTAEEVIALKPALVLTSSFTPAATRRAYARAGLRLLSLDAPATIAASEAQVMQIADAIGEPAKGRAMVAEIEASVTPQPSGQEPSALLFIGGNLVNGSGTLLDAMMRRAGFRNAAADYGLAFTGTLPTETIVRRPPDIVIAPEGTTRSGTLRTHVLAATGARVPQAAFPRRLINCGGPTIPVAMARLRAIRAGM